jgi:hypothetical protein
MDTRTTGAAARKHVVIVGAGFAGLNCAQRLASAKPGFRITLIDKNNYQQCVHARPWRGAIVNTASEAGLVGPPGTNVYSDSKHGVIRLTKAEAGEYAGLNVHVNAIAPGATATPMVTEQSRENQDALIDPQPMHRMADPPRLRRPSFDSRRKKPPSLPGPCLPLMAARPRMRSPTTKRKHPLEAT